MHIKHYHPELKSLLVVVPKVLDLAYARTVSDLPSTASQPRGHGASPATSVGPSPQQRKKINKYGITVGNHNSFALKLQIIMIVLFCQVARQS